MDWEKIREVLIHVLEEKGGNIYWTSEDIADAQIAALKEQASFNDKPFFEKLHEVEALVEKANEKE